MWVENLGNLYAKLVLLYITRECSMFVLMTHSILFLIILCNHTTYHIHHLPPTIKPPPSVLFSLLKLSVMFTILWFRINFWFSFAHIQGIFLLYIRSLTHSASATWDITHCDQIMNGTRKETGNKQSSNSINYYVKCWQIQFSSRTKKEKDEICRFSITPKRERDEP